jgi:hypothetical protein
VHGGSDREEAQACRSKSPIQTRTIHPAAVAGDASYRPSGSTRYPAWRSRINKRRCSQVIVMFELLCWAEHSQPLAQQRVQQPPFFREFRFLVASPPVRDLFVCAKHLFVGAMRSRVSERCVATYKLGGA